MPGDGRGPRPLGLRHADAISTGAMFRSGFFLLPGLAADETGPSVPLAYLLAGLLVVPAVLSTAELGTAFPKAGGPYHFLHRSLGPTVATVGALGLFVAMILKAAFALVGIGAHLAVIVAGSEDERSRLTRLAALLTSQVGSGEVLDRIRDQRGADTALRRSFVEDATRRQGGDPVG